MKRIEYDLIGNQIAVCNKYICILGKRPTLCDREMNVICTFSDIKDYAWADFADDDLMVTRNSRCAYKIYDLNERRCIGTYKARGVNYESFGLPVLDKKNRIIYDASFLGLYRKAEMTIFSVDTRTFRHIPYPYEGTFGNLARIDENGKYRSIAYTVIDKGGNRALLPKIMSFENGVFTFREFRNPPDLRVYFFTDKFIITQLDELIWLDTEEKMQLNVPEAKVGFFCAAIYLKESNRIILGYSNALCVLDLNTNTSLFFNEESYITDLKIIDHDLFVGTRENTVVYKNFVPEVLGENK